MPVFNVESKKKVASAPVRLVRTASSGDWVVADSDMSSVWIRKPGQAAFSSLVKAGWRVTPGDTSEIVVTNCSRVYLPSIAPAAGGVVVCMKLGVKEVEDSGVPFDKCNWGMYLVAFSKDGSTRWHGRYPIHKGNAQVINDPNDSATVLLIASTGIAWRIKVSDGAITQKFHVPMGASGEKNKARCGAVIQTAFVGYTGHPSAVCRVGRDASAIPVASKPPLNGIGDDMTYCDIMSAWGQPYGLWFVLVHEGRLRYNFVGPKAKVAKWPSTKPADGGGADKEARFAPSLFQIPNARKTIGVAFKDDGKVQVQCLSDSASREAVDVGAWPTAALGSDGKIRVLYFKGNELWEASVSCV